MALSFSGYRRVVLRAASFAVLAPICAAIGCSGDVHVVGVASSATNRTSNVSMSSMAGAAAGASQMGAAATPTKGAGALPAPGAGAVAPPRPASDVSPAASDATCVERMLAARSMLMQYCAGCHGNGNREGGFGAVLDASKMIAQQLVVPAQAKSSKLYMLVQSGLMPRGPARPSADEVAALGGWIDCGAPDWNAGSAGAPPFIDNDARLHAMQDDLDALSEEARTGTRYIDFSHLLNAGLSPDEVEGYRGAVSFLLNSLSSASEVVRPSRVGPADSLMRIALEDYGFSDDTWQQLIAGYPYAIRYETEGRFASDEEAAQSLREQTGSAVVSVQADWLLAHASRPPLYYQLLGIGEDVAQYASSLRVDVAGDVEAGRVQRAGFNGSGIALNNRVIERHAQPRDRGAFWLSYDFSANVELRNIFAHPTDFQQDGGEGIFHLRNGLQGYLLANAQLQRIDKAPTDIVTDPHTKDRAVEAGLSCMGGCHLTRGIIVKDDAVRAYAQSADLPDALRERTLLLYPAADVLRAQIAEDNERYLAAVAATGMPLGDENAFHALVRAHEGLLDLGAVAAVLGIPADALAGALDADGADFPLEIVGLRQPGGTIYRDVLETQFAQLVDALGLGARLEP